jgi:hypothetical protein
LLLAVSAGFLGTIIAGVVRNTVMKSVGAKTPSTLPVVVIVYAAIASMAGSAAAVEIDHASGLTSPVWIGTTAGLISGILMALLMITYHMTPRA